MFKNQYFLEKDKQMLIDKYIPKNKQFDFEKLINLLGIIHDLQHFKNTLNSYLEYDIKEAKIGNLTSPIKSACNVLRDVRDILRLCVDFGRMDEESYQFF